jgi:hypothetical protein
VLSPSPALSYRLWVQRLIRCEQGHVWRVSTFCYAMGSSEDSMSFKLQPLSSSNYFRWVVEIECILDMRDLWCAVTEDNEYRALKDDAERAKKSRKAKGFILLNISPKLREAVIGMTTAKEVWDALKTRYQSSTEDRKASLLQQLVSAKQMSGEKMPEFLSRVEGYVRELKDGCNEPVSDGIVMGILMQGVLPAFQDTIAALRCLDNLKLEVVKRKLITTEHSLSVAVSNNGRADKAQAFLTPSQPAGDRRKHFKGRCFNCGQHNHMSRDCPKKKERAHTRDSHGGVALMTQATALHPRVSTSSTSSLLVDTGASHHIAISKDMFQEMHASPIQHVTCGGGEKHPVCGAGTVTVEGVHGSFKMTNTLYVPTFKFNLFSGTAACKKGASISAQGTTLKVVYKGRTVLAADAANGLFVACANIQHVKNVPEDSHHATALTAASVDVWHRRLGHVHHNVLKHMHRESTAVNFNIAGPVIAPDVPCDACVQAKHARNPFPVSTSSTSKPLELIHADVIGKMPCESIGGSAYILTVLDDFSGYSAVACVRRKSDVGDAFAAILATWARQTESRVKRVRTDGGSEFLGEFKSTLHDKGIVHERSVRHTPHSAERYNRTLMERTRSMLFQAQLPQEFWAEAASTACHLHNMMPSLPATRSPQELFKGTKPDLSTLRVFGCLAYSQVPASLRKKLDSRSNKGIFVGYEPNVKGVRLMIPCESRGWKLVISRDVKFVEHVAGFPTLQLSTNEAGTPQSTILTFPLPYLDAPETPPARVQPAAQPTTSTVPTANDEEPDSANSAMEQSAPASEEVNESDGVSEADPDAPAPPAVLHEQPEVRRSSRITSQPDRFDPNAYGCIVDVHALTDEPQSIAEISRRPDKELWEASMSEELTALSEKNVFEWTALPQDRKALPSRWVFKIKRTQTGSVDKYKSRVVAKGFHQKEGVDYTDVFAPGSNLVTLRMLLSTAVKEDLDVHQLDVKTAFLNGDLAEEVYLTPPTGVQGPPGQVWRLRKALYGLKQAAQAWHAKLKSSLSTVGFAIALADPCLYITSVDGKRVYLLVHVDDVLIVGHASGVVHVKHEFIKLFDVRDLGDADVFLGLQIVRNRCTQGTLWLGQSKYIADVLETYNMQNCVSRISPLDANQQFSADGDVLDDSVPYSGAVGSLLYLAVCTRPDIAHAVNLLARFVCAPKQQHWQAIKGVMRYLTGTKILGLLFRRTGGPLQGYSDADFAGDLVKRRSTSGFVFLHAGAAVLWGSKLQQTVAASTCEAELIAGSRAIKEALYLRKLWHDLFVTWIPIPIKMDNQSALILIKNPAAGAQNRSKHIDVCYNFSRHRVICGEIEASFVRTQDMVADVFTKQLPGPAFRMHRENLGVMHA